MRSGTQHLFELGPTPAHFLHVVLPGQILAKVFARRHQGGELPELRVHGGATQLFELDGLHQGPTVEVVARLFRGNGGHAAIVHKEPVSDRLLGLVIVLVAQFQFSDHLCQ
jgi:hypothetical protein